MKATEAIPMNVDSDENWSEGDEVGQGVGDGWITSQVFQDIKPVSLNDDAANTGVGSPHT